MLAESFFNQASAQIAPDGCFHFFFANNNTDGWLNFLSLRDQESKMPGMNFPCYLCKSARKCSCFENVGFF